MPDQFHIAKHMNEAVDEVRHAESTRLRDSSKGEGKQLKNMHLLVVAAQGEPCAGTYR